MRVRYGISEDDAAEYRREDAYEREQARRSLPSSGPDAAEECELCEGTGSIVIIPHAPFRVFKGPGGSKVYRGINSPTAGWGFRQAGYAIPAKDCDNEHDCFACFGTGVSG